MNLDRLQKIALARILSDLIEADFIVEEKEMALFEDLISGESLRITGSMLVEAKKMDFGKAVAVLKELGREDRMELVEVMKRMSLSDGVCAPSEAIQIFAVEQALAYGAAVYSVPARNVNISNHTVIYIENEDDTPVGKAVGEEYEILRAMFAKAGFSFVHVPNVAGDFASMDREYLEKVVKYMIPSVSDMKIGSICLDLCELTTSRFCRDLLYRKTGLNPAFSGPSLLFKVSDSIIVDQFSSDEAERTDYSNFLQIGLDRDVMGTVDTLLGYYRRLDCHEYESAVKPPRRKFIYRGFHRSLFDMIAYGREQMDYRLVFDVSRPQASVYFEPVTGVGERIYVKLTPQEITLFLLIARKSVQGEGLDWREQIPYDEKQAILDEYNRIYSFIGKGNTSSEYKDRTHTNHIKNRIRVIQGISNVDLFIPQHVRVGGRSLYKIKAVADDVVVIGNI